MKKYYITSQDVNQYQKQIECPCCGVKELIYFGDVLGKVLPQDVGKMMVKNGTIWQVENDEQFNRRTKIGG